MNIDVHDKVEQEDKPLTRADVERLLQEAGSSEKLNLSGQNMQGIRLNGFVLTRANLQGSNLIKASFIGADLYGANFYRANLYGAFLFDANLAEADLRDADLHDAELFGANLRGADLRGANLYRTDLRGADLLDANFRKADLQEAILKGAGPARMLRAMNLDKSKAAIAESSTFRIRIVEEPLTAQNLTTIISSLTELHTKLWLIAKGRFSDLIEYTQTHNVRFAEEANLVITRMVHDSPLEINFAPLDPKNIMDAVVTAIDGVIQVRERLKKAKLENQEKAEQIRQAAQKANQEYEAKQQEMKIGVQKADQETQMVLLERKKQEIELERLQFSLQIERANKLINFISLSADPATKEMFIQCIMPPLMQIQNVKGLELVLSIPQNSEEKQWKEK